MAHYINNKTDEQVETIDEFDTYKEAREALKEYHLNWWATGYYLSTRCTKEWRETSNSKETS